MSRRKHVVQLPYGPVDAENGHDVDLDTEEIFLSDGTRLSDEVAEQIAQEVVSTDEHRADVEEAHRRARGRPRLSDKGSERITVTVTHAQNAALRRAADVERRSASQIVRDALDAYFDRQASWSVSSATGDRRVRCRG